MNSQSKESYIQANEYLINCHQKIIESSSINSAVLLGFPNYSGLTASNKALNTDTLTFNLNNYYSNATRGAIIKSLPETKVEIEKISHLLFKNGWDDLAEKYYKKFLK